MRERIFTKLIRCQHIFAVLRLSLVIKSTEDDKKIIIHVKVLTIKNIRLLLAQLRKY